MTNSKQWCDYCGERWNYDRHNNCALMHRINRQHKYLYKDGVTVSTVRVNTNGTLTELGKHLGKAYASEAEWKAAYPDATTSK